MKNISKQIFPKFSIKLIKAIKLLFSGLESSSEINFNKFKKSRFYPDRFSLINDVFPGGNILEVGTEHGRFAKRLLTLKGLKKLVTVDRSYSQFELKKSKKLFCVEGMTKKVLPTIKENFSIIYLDASHDYKSVKEDLDCMNHLLIKGTILIFNDFSIIDKNFNSYGVHKAACEFINRRECVILGLAFEKNAQYDIAIMIQ